MMAHLAMVMAAQSGRTRREHYSLRRCGASRPCPGSSISSAMRRVSFPRMRQWPGSSRGGQAYARGQQKMSLIGVQAGVASRAEAQRCYGAAASGVDCSVIALWLGHESIETTQTYLHAHLALKEAALAKLEPYERGKRTRVRPILLAFLEAL
jgi:hypothetical protein